MFKVSRTFQDEENVNIEIEVSVNDAGVTITRYTRKSTESMTYSFEEALIVLMLLLDSSGIIMSKKSTF